MSLTAIVVNYRTPRDLDGFCRSFERHPPKTETSLIVANVFPFVDDLRVGRYWSHRLGASHICWKENIGYGRAVNSAALSARDVDVLVAFNADTRLTENVLDSCHDALMEHQDWGVLGPRQIDEEGLVTHGGIFGTHERPEFRGWRRPDSAEFGDVREAITVSGSAFFVKRECWDQLTACPIYQEAAAEPLGAFLPTPHYYEEEFCAFHAWAHGWKVIYFGKATMFHHWHRASPHGGWADQQTPISKQIFIQACEAHGIPHES